MDLLLPVLVFPLLSLTVLGGLYAIGRRQFLTFVVTVTALAVLTSLLLAHAAQMTLVYAFSSSKFSPSISLKLVQTVLAGLAQPTVGSVALCGVLYVLAYTVAKGVDLIEQTEVLLQSHDSFMEREEKASL
ncbi:hypothetical protein AGDE_17154 [Angomonas deanei]|uniref:Uncharacterized protein n=1 Tax=Angomonas deanei TaxID=59799 RepID=A0A7G2C0S5_9TRYP|nr:hypothetical protein AGDE_17154 [Angomonas deanei]CAD2212924.1 hypothetical protein, conserved [Angomonas deanei]|eukprot:EPY15334.1 hypothetical protein AGDE_17154 [Angomonas deanei]